MTQARTGPERRLNGDARDSAAVSVVVPSRGRPALLVRALNSILEQRYDGDVECVVVFDGDDGAADASVAAIASELSAGARRQVRTLHNTRTPGASGARNAGALVARGEVLAFCDDDDEWLPGKLEAQVAALLADPSSSASTCGIEVAYRAKSVLRLPEADRVRFDDLLRSRLAHMHTSTFLVRREDFVGRIGLFDEAIPDSYAEDYDWLLRASRVGPVLTLREPLARIHWHESSFFQGHWETISAALQYLVHKYPEFRRDPVGLARIQGQIAFAHAAAGRPRDARTWSGRCLMHDRRQPRAYLAVLVSLGIIQPERLLSALRRVGRGI